MKTVAWLILPVACTLLVAPAPPAEAGSYERCKPVSNPYPNTRYEGIPLSRIRAQDVGCHRARRVARGAHRKALREPNAGSVERFTWRGWKVKGDLSGPHDRYIARRGEKRVRWQF